VQGYLFSRPLPPQQVLELLRQQNQTAQIKPARRASVTTKRNKGGTKSARRR
jgi:hypothetical protein